jgi:hypothetical protein
MQMALCLSIVARAACRYVKAGGKAVSSASIALIFIFGSVFAFAFTLMQPIYPWEVLSNDIRTKGIGVFSAHRWLRWLRQYFCRSGGAQQGWCPSSSLSAVATA